MTIGVVIPTYNRADLLPTTLETILAQTVRPDKVIVVDDEFTDNTADILERYNGVLSLQVVRIRNSGDLAARNAGVQLCDTDLVAFCDSDDLWTSDHLQRIADLWRACPELKVAYANFCIIRDGEWEEFHKFDHAPASFWDGLEPAGSLVDAGIFHFPIVDRLIDYQPFFPSAMVVNREAFLAIGGWDEEPGRTIGGDFATALRMAECVPFGVVHHPTVGIRKHRNNRSADMQRMNAGDSLVLEHVLETRPALGPFAAKIRSSIVHRRLQALDTAFCRQDYDGVREIFALLPLSHRNGSASVKARVAEFPAPLRWLTVKALLAGGSLQSKLLGSGREKPSAVSSIWQGSNR